MDGIDPRIQQYRTGKSVLELLERLTYQEFGNLEELEVMAVAIDNEIARIKSKGNSSRNNFGVGCIQQGIMQDHH